jgi:Flp pilus assembly protein TadD
MSRIRNFAAVLVAALAGVSAPAAGQSVQYRSPAGVEYRSQPDTGAIARAEQALAADPRNLERIIQLGTAQSGVRQFREAIQTFTRGLAIAPNDPMLYRWRGHRYLSVRELDRAMDDLTRGYRLDSTNYGILYHLGIVRFARGDFAGAADAFARAQSRAPEAGELAGSTDWRWMSLSRAGRTAEATAMLARHPDSLPVNNAYARRLKLYRGEIGPDEVFTPADTADVQVATLSFGVGNWYLVRGDTARARSWFERSIRSGGWPGFGFIISEVELRRTAAARPPPSRLSDSAFWKLVGDISEPGGYFRITDNFTSNEGEVGELSTMLRATGVSGGVYIGVGPEQNLSYIAAIRPTMAFVVDIRRQAVMQHLMFKAMFELAKDRADFITLLFAKPRPGGIDSTTTIPKLWEAYRDVPTDTVLGRRIIARIEDHLTRVHGFTFTKDEAGQLRSVLEAFQFFGPDISTRSSSTGSGGFSGGRGGRTRGFVDMTGFAYDNAGKPQSFLSTEDNYRYVKALHEHNLIVAVSGDFAGPKAIRAIGAWVREQGGVVSAFYVSNVEQYLFQDGHAQAFYDNVATLPLNEQSVFIRPYSMRRYGRSGYGGDPLEPVRSLCPIEAFLQAVAAGKIHQNNDALACVP